MIRVVPQGLIETIRARNGRVPWLDRHMARLAESLAALQLPPPPDDIERLLRIAAGSEDRVVRLELRDGRAELTTRPVNTAALPSIVISTETHMPYPYKTTERRRFGKALASARRVGADDAVLLTASGYVAEGTAWSLFWWGDGAPGNGNGLCTPAQNLGILKGIGRARIMELAPVREVHARKAALKGRSLFLVNAVRGVVEIGSFEGEPVPRDKRTAELSSSFWPD